MQKNQHEIIIPFQYFGKFIGRKGVNIKKIMSSYDCKILYDEDMSYLDYNTNNTFQPLTVLITNENYMLLKLHIEKDLIIKPLTIIKEIILSDLKDDEIIKVNQFIEVLNLIYIDQKTKIIIKKLYTKFQIFSSNNFLIQKITEEIDNFIKPLHLKIIQSYILPRHIKNNLLKNKAENLINIVNEYDVIINLINVENPEWCMIMIKGENQQIEKVFEYIKNNMITNQVIQEILIKINWKNWYNDNKKGEFMIIGTYQHIQQLIVNQKEYQGQDKEIHLIANVPLTEIINLCLYKTKHQKINVIDSDGNNRNVALGLQTCWLNCDNILFKSWQEYLAIALNLKWSENDIFNGISVVGLFFNIKNTNFYDGNFFVGGTFDSTLDSCLFETAKREMKEEIGLQFINNEEISCVELPTTHEYKKIWLTRAVDLESVI